MFPWPCGGVNLVTRLYKSLLAGCELLRGCPASQCSNLCVQGTLFPAAADTLACLCLTRAAALYVAFVSLHLSWHPQHRLPLPCYPQSHRGSTQCIAAVPERPLKESAQLQVWALGASVIEMAVPSAWAGRAQTFQNWNHVSTSGYQHQQATHCIDDWNHGQFNKCHLVPQLSILHATMLRNALATSTAGNGPLHHM